MRLKDPLPSIERSAAVYKIDCMDCQCNYIGETAKRVKTRVHEHRLAVRRGDQYSQIWAHMAELGHRFNFSEVSVLASDNTKGGRLLREAWLSDSSSINRHVDLCPAYVALRSWNTNNQRQHPRRSGDSLNDIKEGVLTPQLIRSNPKEERQPWNISITSTTLPQSQKTKETVEIKTQNSGITSTRGNTTNVKEDTASGGGEELLNMTAYPRTEGNVLAFSERKERSPRPARIVELGEWEPQSAISDRPGNITGEKEKNRSEWKERWEGEICEVDEAQEIGLSHPPLVDPEDLREIRTDSNSVRKKRKVEKRYCGNQGERDPVTTPPRPTTRSTVRAKQLDITIARKPPPPMAKQLTSQPQTSIMLHPIQNSLQDHPDDRRIERESIKIKRESYCKKNKWTKDVWGGNTECTLPSEPGGEESKHRDHRNNRGYYPSTPGLREGRMDEDGHVTERSRKERTSREQLNQSGPMTRSRSRAQALTCL